MPSPPLSKFSASTVPGTSSGAPEYGLDAPPDPPAPALLLTMMAPRFIAPTSKRMVMTCAPAASVSGTDTVVQLCQLPVDGTAMLPETLLGALNVTCMDAPLIEATRSCTVYAPAEATLTV